MSDWGSIPPNIRKIAKEVCTPEEIDVLKLADRGYGYRAMARALGVDRDTARNRWQRASRKIRDRMEMACDEQPDRPAEA